MAEIKIRHLRPLNLSSPQSLFSISIKFIVDHMDLVDSLIGIPEVIGHQLFDRFCSHLSQNKRRPCSNHVKLFADAYGEKLASQLQLSNSLLVIDEFYDVIKVLLPRLVKIDLSRCGLADDDEIIEMISIMKCLKFVNLSKNSLTDKTLKRLADNYPEGPAELIQIDLSYNKMTEEGLKQLSCFRKLEELDVTGNEIDVKKLAKGLNMKISNRKTKIDIETKGWCKFIQSRQLTKPFLDRAIEHFMARSEQYESIKKADLTSNTVVLKRKCEKEMEDER